MNGARPVLAAIISTAISSSAIMMGVSHHFLRSFKNNHKSFKNSIPAKNRVYTLIHTITDLKQTYYQLKFPL